MTVFLHTTMNPINKIHSTVAK